MPSKEDVCVEDSLPNNFLSADVEELVAAIKHNFHLKSKPSHSVYSKHRRMSPYAAPVRAVCRNKLNNSDIPIDHSSPNCKYCILRSKSSKDSCSDDPYEILTFLRKGILISEAVKRLQKRDLESSRCKKTDFYDLDDVEVSVESV
ncbi:hypothetical protein AVEN_231561-1 [Araneus ventricosus]|uniref:Uncharacterized protein n=1 Tax=Araneus ventricosus TaxID=182803 RepID=A0A4Y2RLP4_ARAVE|nr:hypothetical protein AVEN_66510-1 [Araneus ventricosus]GBN76704.1 hypothetical protein AVEN_61359-1 [Araneus ventricosus]GBN84363.1 hypothetical protein AVEN_113878-1 [Araneus ventricosus]GBN84366.1 hypothetical protein AVEN_231561-1 [Araneus ventricosus]